MTTFILVKRREKTTGLPSTENIFEDDNRQPLKCICTTVEWGDLERQGDLERFPPTHVTLVVAKI